MTKQDKRRWERLQELRRQGWEISKDDINTIDFHHGSETIKHIAVKALLSHSIVESGSVVITEASHAERGRADVLDLNPDGRSIVYEIETGSSSDPEQRELKQKQYLGEVVTECLVLDPLEVPDSLTDLSEWAERRVL